ncbi:hypothetical protein DICPUDRAFT_57752, partial [Dictyostelium purpureum]
MNFQKNEDSSQSNMIVTVRIRPESEEEILNQKCKNIIKIVDENTLIFDPNETDFYKSSSNKSAFSNNGSNNEQRYIFDRIFDQFSTQQEVFENTTKKLINYVLEGNYNASVFAYGATNAGKTHTMVGNDHSGPGIMVLTMKELFESIEKDSEKVYTISMSYLEVYNETIRDLFVTDSKSLELREDSNKSVVVRDLTERFPNNANDVLKLLEFGNSNRKQSPTQVNQTSSRSHAV